MCRSDPIPFVINIYKWLYLQCILKTYFDYFATIFFYNKRLCHQCVLKTKLHYFSRKAAGVLPNSAKYLFGHVFGNDQIASTHCTANDVSG
jgi:hypothetical protein